MKLYIWTCVSASFTYVRGYERDFIHFFRSFCIRIQWRLRDSFLELLEGFSRPMGFFSHHTEDLICTKLHSFKAIHRDHPFKISSSEILIPLVLCTQFQGHHIRCERTKREIFEANKAILSIMGVIYLRECKNPPLLEHSRECHPICTEPIFPIKKENYQSAWHDITSCTNNRRRMIHRRSSWNKKITERRSSVRV